LEELLPYYEQELALFGRHAKDFAQLYPKIASRLLMSGEAVEDPHIERLIQAFSLIAARINKKLNDGYGDFTASLFEVLYPDYLRPFPSCSIAAMDTGQRLNQLTEPVFAERGTMLQSKAIRGVHCRFRTVYPVRLLPIELTQLKFNSVIPDEFSGKFNASIKLSFHSLTDGFDWQHIINEPLRLFMDTDASSVARLREVLLDNKHACRMTLGNQHQTFAQTPFKQVGFQSNESILPKEPRAQQAYRLITEYFAFPEKFNFVDLDLHGLKPLANSTSKTLSVELFFKLDLTDMTQLKAFEQLHKSHLRLFCTPVVNLFKRPAEPIRINHQQREYPLIVDVRQPSSYEIYSIDRVHHVRETPNGQTVLEIHPFYSLNHHQSSAKNHYYHMVRDSLIASNNPGFECQVMMMDRTFNPSEIQIEVLSVDITCTNRQLASQLPYGQQGGDLFQEQSGAFRQVQLLRKPTTSYRFDHAGEGRWRLVSHLSLNALSFAQEDAALLREMFTLYDLPQTNHNRKQIEGLAWVKSTPTTTRIAAHPYPLFVRGLEIQIGLHEDHFIGTGMWLLGDLLSHVMGLQVGLNSFVQVVLKSADHSRELRRCPPRNGLRALV
jgi:type VI secretion system protein ImpG